MKDNMLDLIARPNEKDIISEIQINGYYIDKVEKTPERCMIAVKQNGLVLKVIPKVIHTQKLCLEAVTQAGMAVQYVSKKVINAEICMKAVKNNGNALMYIPPEFFTSKLYVEAVKQDGKALRFVPDERRTEELCLIAISQNGSAIEYVSSKILSKEISKKAVEQNGLALEYVPKNWKSKDLCLLAVNNNALALEYVPSRFKTKEICELAVQNNWKAFLYMPENMYSIQVCLQFFENIVGSFSDLKEITFNNRLYIREIVARLPEIINDDARIIKLERQLEARIIKNKLYNKNIEKFVVEEYLCYKENDESIEFETFPEFYDYLDGNLSDADLHDFNFESINLTKLNIDGAFISSDVLISQNLYDDTFYNLNIREIRNDAGLMLSAENEVIEACTVLHESDFGAALNEDVRKIYYISDIHINHKLIKEFPKHATKQEIAMFIRSFVRNMVDTATEKSYDDYLLVAGDVSFNYEISAMFHSELANMWNPTHIIAILGNHELWDSNRNGRMYSCVESLEDIIYKYRELFSSLKICFLQNDLLIFNDSKPIVILEEQLKSVDVEIIKELCLKSSLIIFGGVGYSGYNSDFNATQGIYRNTIISLEEDIEQTKRFESIYKMVNNMIGDNRVIVLTHTPKDNWTTEEYNHQWIYVNGHTHKNDYCCNEECTMYADNQIGYHIQSAALKHFNLSLNYDIFRYYTNGIYTITREEYLDFNRGINSNISFNRIDGSINMLKNYGIYCFILKNEKTGKLYLLNGGAIKTLEQDNVDYYFEKMVFYSNAVKGIFREYHDALKSLSNSIKAIGGTGKIHGCIVDIDMLNHVYLKLENGEVIPYYALSIIEKYVYKNICSLLKKERPDLYLNYKRLINSKSENELQVVRNMDSESLEISQFIPDTFMYGRSRIIKSLQYIMDVNVIRLWDDRVIEIGLTNKKYIGIAGNNNTPN